jgi:hypothetical protein
MEEEKVSPVEYRFIRAYGQYWRSPGDYIEYLVGKARSDGAPQDVYDGVTALTAKFKGARLGDRDRCFSSAPQRTWLRWRASDHDPKLAGPVAAAVAAMKPVAGLDVPEPVTEQVIFASGAMSYSWWLEYQRNWSDAAEDDLQAPKGWVWRVTGGNDEDTDDQKTAVITHEVILRTARLIVAGDGGKYVPKNVQRECALLLFDHESVDLDASAADVVLQVAVFGKVIYG